MKKIFIALMLLISISSNLFAQTSNTDQTFEPAANSITRIYFIDLDKRNKIKLELVDLDDLDAIGNLDSILRNFIQDIEPLKDSLADQLSGKRIDYIMDPSGKNKLRIRQFAPIGSSYLINQGSIAALKIEQDTLNILLKGNGTPVEIFKNKKPGFHYFRISFYVNNLSDLSAYMDGKLQNSILDLRKNANHAWVKGNDGMMHAKGSPKISSNLWRGQAIGSDYLNIRLSADLQNYKNYFVPSLSFSGTIVTNRRTVKREYSLTGEAHFTFAKDDKGKLQTYRSSFLTLGFNQLNKSNMISPLGFSPSFSLGYLIKQRGDIFDKHTFRLGFGRVSLFNDRIKLEPIVYFHDFFKGITPGIRLSF